MKPLEQVNRHLQELIDASTWAQLQIELTLDGKLLHPVYPGPHSSAKVLLSRVKATREAIDAFEPPWRWRRSTGYFEDDSIYMVRIAYHSFTCGTGFINRYRLMWAYQHFVMALAVIDALFNMKNRSLPELPRVSGPGPRMMQISFLFTAGSVHVVTFKCSSSFMIVR